MVIDYHTHFVPPDCQEFEVVSDAAVRGSRTDTETGELWVDGRLRRLGAAGDQPWGGAPDNPLWSLERRLEDMARTGVELQVLSVPPYMCLYDVPADASWKLSRRANAGMAAAIGGDRRFVGFATVPLQDPPVAARELEYAVSKLGLGGVQILTHVGEHGLDDPRLAVFWKAVTDLDVPVFVHPANTRDPHQRRYYLNNLVGNPTETAVATGHIVFGGVLDRFPSLRFVLAHAGGTVPALLGRWEHGSQVIPELDILQRPVRDYLSAFWFDTAAHDARFLGFMLATLGLQLVVGTDYPFDMGDLEPLKTLEEVPVLTAEQRAAIAATDLLGLDARIPTVP